MAKGFVIIKHNSNQLSSVSNDAKLRIHVIDQQKTDFLMAKTAEIYSVENNIKKLHTQSDFHLVYKKKFYHDKEKELDNFFDECHLPLLKDIDNPALIQEWK